MKELKEKEMNPRKMTLVDLIRCISISNMDLFNQMTNVMNDKEKK